LSISRQIASITGFRHFVADSIELLISQVFRNWTGAARVRPCSCRVFIGRQDTNVAQRSIEMFIGRLITDEGFRGAFVTNASAALRQFIESGHELTTVEIAALIATRTDLWADVADRIDQRLQKANLPSDESGSWLF